MPASARVGQMCCAGAIVILIAILPWRPASAGVPYARIQETAAIWIAYALLMWGSGQTRQRIGMLAGDVSEARRLKARLNSVSGALCMTALTAIVSLTSIVATTLHGARLISLPHGSYLYPSEFNYALVVPLGFALLCHLSAAAMRWPDRVAIAPPFTSSVFRRLMQIALSLLLAMFLLTVIGSFADRWLVVGAVIVTWIASWIFLGLAIEQVNWSASLPLPSDAPFAPH